MSWNLVSLSAIAPLPWRNGGGITRVLISWPDAYDWIWRISVAEVASDGAFSYFDGVQRWLAILSGAVRLSMGADEIELTERCKPLAFDGATPVHCTLLDGPAQDLNLMLRMANPASRLTGEMRRIDGMHHLETANAKIVAIYSAATPAVLEINGSKFTLPEATLAWQTLPPATNLAIAANSAVLMEITLES